MDLAAAYAVFANGGFKVEPYLIDHIADSDGHILLQEKSVHVCQSPCKDTPPDLIAPRVIPADVAFLMNSALKGVIQQGTAVEARSLNRTDIAGKTGTTNEQVDAWFAGYNPDLVVTTWIGYDTPHPLHEYAARLALPLWIDFMKVALQGKPQRDLPQPANIVSVRINPDNGLLAKAGQTNAIGEYFRDTDVPGLDEESTASSGGVSGGEREDDLF